MRTSINWSVVPYLLSLALFRRTAAQEVTTDSIQSSFTQAKIVPDILSSFEPSGVLEMFFTQPGTSTRTRVTPGMNLTKSQTSSPPSFGISGLPPSFVPQTFAIALVDPDAPTPQSPTAAQFLHFLGGDFELRGELAETTPALMNQSRAVVEYTGPNPPSGSPPHRYIVLVYNQNTLPNTESNFGTTSAPFANSSTPRNNFNVSRFAEEVMLTGPVAGTYFYVAPEVGGGGPSANASGVPSSTSSESKAPTTTTSANSALSMSRWSLSMSAGMSVAVVMLVVAATV